MMKVCEKRILHLIGVLIILFIYVFFGGGGITHWFEVKRLYL